MSQPSAVRPHPTGRRESPRQLSGEIASVHVRSVVDRAAGVPGNLAPTLVSSRAATTSVGNNMPGAGGTESFRAVRVLTVPPATAVCTPPGWRELRACRRRPIPPRSCRLIFDTRRLLPSELVGQSPGYREGHLYG